MLVTSPREFQGAYDILWKYRDSGFVVDTETTGLDMWAAENPARLCSIQLAPIADTSKRYYFPFRHGEGLNLDLVLLQPLRELLVDTTWLGHNIPFDAKILFCDGFSLPKALLDSRMASQLANENEQTSKQGSPYALKKLCAQYFGVDTIEAQLALKAELKKRKLSTKDGGLGNLWRLPAEVVCRYGLDDLTLAKRLHDFKLEELQRWRLVEAYERKCRAMMVLLRMEIRGVLLDFDEVDRQMSMLGPRLQELEVDLKVLLGDVNPDSPKQLANFLQIPKTDKKFLGAILEANPAGAHPAIRKVLERREGKKATRTYFRPFKAKADTARRLHTSFNAGGARTGRYSSSGPNMQNCSKDRASYSLKKCFKAAPGHFLMEVDYSSLEPRVGAYFTRDPSAIEVFRNGLDYYKPIAAKMFNMSEAEITKEFRDKSKSTALGVGYGMGSWKLAVTQGLKHPRLPDGTYERHSDLVWHMPKGGELQQVPCSDVDPVYCTCEGKKLVRWFFDAVPSMQPTIKAVTQTMQRNGYIRYPLSGRVRRLETYWNSDRKRLENTSHKAWNSLLQGTGADIMEAALIAIDEQIPESAARMLITVHDSILFEIADTPRSHDVCKHIIHLMETTTKIDPVPLVAEAKYGDCWGTLKTYDRTLAQGA